MERDGITLSGRPERGKLIAAHPSRVAQADQIAAAEGANGVRLSELLPTTHAYIIDIDALMTPDERLRRIDL